ncbi:MAG: UDP-N-acetylmuramate dehydrogenase [Candidatus Heteroscillospira sp.]|jgi:UDP-N-acetylmuramate dehydrogenase
MTEALVNELRQKMPGLELLADEPMKNYCSFRIGGPAVLALPENEERLCELLAFMRRAGEKPFVLGKGTNVLFPDCGTRRLVIRPAGELTAIRALDDTRLEAGCGASLAALACYARDRGLTGLEFAHGIPGSVGGAVFMNAGAYGGEMVQVLESVRYLDGESGEIREKPVSELELGYRCSRFCGREDVILSAVVCLEHGNTETIAARMRELAEKRRASQPLDKPSAGSTFKRPAVGYAAALIDECGLKGFSVGGAQVSEKHAGFVVNTGAASSADVLELMARVQKIVLDKTGVELQPEVRIIE